MIQERGVVVPDVANDNLIDLFRVMVLTLSVAV